MRIFLSCFRLRQYQYTIFAAFCQGWRRIQLNLPGHYRQLCINLPPVADHIRPLFGQIMRGKIECFEQSSAVRKDTSATVQAAVPAVQTFNGVCCVDHLSDGLGELEHGTDGIPIRLPTSHGSRIFFVPFLTDSQHIPMCGLLIRSVVDGLQIVCKVLSVFIRDIFQRILNLSFPY